MVKPVDFKQNDRKWGGLSYAVDGERSTIKSAGCGPTAMASVLAALVSPYIDPVTCAAWARQHGHKVYKSGTSYRFPVEIGKEYGITVRRINTVNVYGYPHMVYHDQALQALKDGNWLIACMGPGNWTKSGHYIVAYSYNAGTVDIMDPASAKQSRAHSTWELFKSQVKYYWVVEVPAEVKRYGLKAPYKYRHEDFVREVQMCLKAGIDGVAGPQTLGKTVTVSKAKNRKHYVVRPLQKYLKSLGLYTGAFDGVAGTLFDSAVRSYQVAVLKMQKSDGEITARARMWKSLLKIE